MSGGLGSFWRRLSRLDAVALVVAALYGVVTLGRVAGVPVPPTGFLTFLVVLAAGYFLVRFLAWLRAHGLWSLRNRLIVAYLFIAVVPVILLLGIGALAAYVIYSQLGAHVLQTDLQQRIERVAAIADAVARSAAAQGIRRAENREAAARIPGVQALVSSADPALPGLEVEVGGSAEILAIHGGPGKDRFAGLVQDGDKLWVRAVVARPSSLGQVVVSASVAVTEQLLGALAPRELSIVQLTVWRSFREGDAQGLVFQSGDRRYVPIRQILAPPRVLPPAEGWLDFEVTGTCKLEAVSLAEGSVDPVLHPVFAPFSARAVHLNRRLFSSLGELGGRPIQLLVAVAVVFLVLEVVALRAGVKLTRSITRAVNDLSRATEHVQAGNLTHTVRIQQRDQLGALGESFNEMMGSIAALIEEQRQRQRLENELSIAREVQEQLFPKALPSLPGIELAAVCRAARTVSGDYYDFIPMGHSQLAMAIADICGKGISAALLMASLQAALRSQVLLDSRNWRNTADLVGRLNQHLFLNTSPERYATFFFAVYDAETRTLYYTNAGHLPPLCIVGEQVRHLEEGGMVVGLFDDCTYEQGTISIEPGSLVVAYSDGLIEAENAYGEEFGRKGLQAEVLRHRNAPAQQLAEALVRAAEEWAASPEQADDMTVIVARMK